MSHGNSFTANCLVNTVATVESGIEKRCSNRHNVSMRVQINPDAGSFHSMLHTLLAGIDSPDTVRNDPIVRDQSTAHIFERSVSVRL